jgi:sortase A
MSDEFGIVIPKIRANAKVINNIDPFNSKEYQWALTKGVAHAKGTAYPGHAGNTFIFAHSSVDWYIANRYNSVFYLLHKLEKGDKIEMYYKKKKYVYEVTVKKYVDASDVSYLNSQNSLNSLNTSILTLMTCWPPGTTYKRLIVQAKISIDKGN